MKKGLLRAVFSIIVLSLFILSKPGQAQGLVPMNFAASKPKATHSKSVLETISTSGRTQLTELIMQAGLIAELSGKNEYTFFAPSDAAIVNLKALPADKLHSILLNHLVQGRFTTDDLKEGTKLKTLGGDQVTIIRKGSTILISGIAIASANEHAGNGIIHTLSSSLY